MNRPKLSADSPVAAHVAAFLTSAIWGTTFVSTKVLILHGLTPMQIFSLRFLMAYVLLLPFKRGPWFARSLKDELSMLLLGVLGGSAYFAAENFALSYSPATNVSLIVCSCPLYATLLFLLFYKDMRLRRRQAVGTLLAFLGMILVVLNGHFVLRLSPVGDLLAFAACLAWATYSLLMRPMGQKYRSLFITRKIFFYGLLTVFPFYFFGEPLPTSAQLCTPVVVANLLFLGGVASMLCYLVWTWSIRRLGAMQTTNYVYINPVSTIIFAWLILQETITPWFLLGAASILFGLYLCNSSGTLEKSRA